MAKEYTCPNGSRPDPEKRSCVGGSVRVQPKSFGREIEISRFLPHGSFKFTSPNVISAKSKDDKSVCVNIQVEAIRKKNTKTAAKGTKYQKNVKLPYACPPKTKFVNGKCSDGSEPKPHISCGNRGTPCGTDRQTCPVQFVFKAGVPHLRFCGAKGQKAPLVKVTNPKEAQALATKACAQWERTTRRDAKGRIETPGQYTKNIYKAPLGRLR